MAKTVSKEPRAFPILKAPSTTPDGRQIDAFKTDKNGESSRVC
jgi:hypothetical protein